MSLSYNNVNLSINGSYIMAESVNVSQSSPQKPIYNFNNSNPFDNVPTNLKTSVSISYYLNADNGSYTPIYNSDLNNQLINLSWQIPSPGYHIYSPVTSPVNQTFIVAGSPNITYSVNLLFRGVVEGASYTGGAIIPNTSGLAITGATYINDGHNIYALLISNPPQVYYLNNSGTSAAEVIRYSLNLNINGGATIILSGNVIDGTEDPNYNLVSLFALPGEPPVNSSIPQPFTGQFLQMDATGSAMGMIYTAEPNFSIINSLRNDTTIAAPSLINIGNVFTTGYLSNFSLQLAPNGLVKANCSFDIFTPFTGNIQAQGSTDSVFYDTLNSSGLAHYWAANFISGSNINSDNRVLQMSYSAQIGITPIYSIGNSYPCQIYVNGITESIDLLTELQYNAIYSGQTFDINRPDIQNLVLSGIASTGMITIPMTGFILSDSKFDLSSDNLILFSNTYNRSR